MREPEFQNMQVASSSGFVAACQGIKNKPKRKPVLS
jgi:hypothetical protein